MEFCKTYSEWLDQYLIEREADENEHKMKLKEPPTEEYTLILGEPQFGWCDDIEKVGQGEGKTKALAQLKASLKALGCL